MRLLIFTTSLFFVLITSSAFSSKEKEVLKSEVISCKVLCDGSSKLEWITTKEIKNNYFKIQVSNNAYSWTTIKSIKGKGLKSLDKNKKYKYKIPQEHKYYRLIETNEKGDEIEHKMLINICLVEPEISIYPMSSNQSLLIKSSDYEKVPSVQLQLIDHSGQLVWENILKLQAPETFVKLGHQVRGRALMLRSNVKKLDSLTIIM